MFCLTAIFIYDVLLDMSLNIFLLCARKEYYTILSSVFYSCMCQRAKSMQNNTVCKFNYRKDLIISASRCGAKTYIYIGTGIVYQPNDLYNIDILDIGKKSTIVHLFYMGIVTRVQKLLDKVLCSNSYLLFAHKSIHSSL